MNKVVCKRGYVHNTFITTDNRVISLKLFSFSLDTALLVACLSKYGKVLN